MAYNRYNATTGSYRRVPEPPVLVSPLSETSDAGSPRSGVNRGAPPPDESRERHTATRVRSNSSGLLSDAETTGQHLLRGLESILPAGLDAGDLALAALLFLLYVESGDEDFLIMLIVTGFSIFKDLG